MEIAASRAPRAPTSSRRSSAREIESNCAPTRERRNVPSGPAPARKGDAVEEGLQRGAVLAQRENGERRLFGEHLCARDE